MNKAGPTSRATGPEGVKQNKPAKQFDGVVISKPKNFDRGSYSSTSKKPRKSGIEEEERSGSKHVHFDDNDKVIEISSEDVQKTEQPAKGTKETGPISIEN